MQKLFKTNSVEETYQVAHEFLSEFEGNIIALFGDLGSGKTTFTQGIGKTVGITQRINSPTFILMRRYEIPQNTKWDYLFHVDLYRLNSKKEIEELGILDLMSDKKNLFVIEWAEKMKELFPETTQYFELYNKDDISEGMREIRQL